MLSYMASASPPGEVGASAAFEEQRVAGDEAAVDEEALAARRVPGCVQEPDRHVAGADLVAAVVHDEVGVGRAGHALDPRRLGPLHVERRRHVVHGEELARALDRVAHEVAADVIGVVVGDERAGDAHAVGRRGLDELAHAVRGVDGQCVSRFPIADEVREVDHLPGDGIVAGEVAPGEQLAEVETVGHGPDPIRGG